MNEIRNRNLIYAGEKLNVRRMRPAAGKTYTVKRGDTLWGISRRYGTTVSAIARLNRLKDLRRPDSADSLIFAVKQNRREA
jgi:nucleoid-associated protein YgaU